jgi:hypothetical protein
LTILSIPDLPAELVAQRVTVNSSVLPLSSKTNESEVKKAAW